LDVLRSAKCPPSNLTIPEQQALSRLQKNSAIMVLPADKGRTTVVLDKSEYEAKVTCMLSDVKTYEKLAKDPTAGYKRRLVSILTRLKEEEKISNELYSHLYSTSEKIPQLYCLPKIHKKDFPFRPIVDYTGSIGYNTSRFLADILSPLVGKSDHFVKNSQHLAEDLINLRLDADDILISHDVISLFTNIPIAKSLEVIKGRLENNCEWKDTCLLEVDDII